MTLQLTVLQKTNASNVLVDYTLAYTYIQICM